MSRVVVQRQVPSGLSGHELAALIVAELTEHGETVALAESLTGGLLTSALVDVPGASAVVRGGVVAYATDLNATLLGVDEELLARVGAVHHEVALQMASGVRERLAATYGLATTGVAGPDPQDGRAPGTVFVAVATSEQGGVATEEAIAGDRAAVRSGTVLLALELLAAQLGLHLPDGWAGLRDSPTPVGTRDHPGALTRPDG